MPDSHTAKNSIFWGMKWGEIWRKKELEGEVNMEKCDIHLSPAKSFF